MLKAGFLDPAYIAAVSVIIDSLRRRRFQGGIEAICAIEVNGRKSVWLTRC